ncbi:sarcosine oxidase subunit gamma [Humibacillus xanthopallidus]|uniref:Sarcosine oxidase subunit gamma n=1 Tax=Humibacillus xanthopallidus TaxID=412689 RepID=A0A543PM40_9MICO|nr:sarcosine oxidase subunit gamma family protein [Humibacillus xanthopallidus]TQN45134.1 sarcosine oxidase subunit gamma [Humibacillus xanthopallidus]
MADSTLTIDPPQEQVGDTTGSAESGSRGIGRAAVLAHRRSPAHDLVEEMEQGSGERVRLRELPFLSQLAVRAASAGRSSAAVAGALGVALPSRVGEVTGATDGSGVAVLWLSPDEVLAVGQDEGRSGLSPDVWSADVAQALASEPGQVVDVSANRTTLELSGPCALQVLQKSCELDLHPRVFPVGAAVATLLGSTGVILWRTGEQSWRVMPRASFATHVVRWLLDGMREFR